MLEQLQQFVTDNPYLVGALVLFLVWYFFVRSQGFSAGETIVKGIYDEDKK